MGESTIVANKKRMPPDIRQISIGNKGYFFSVYQPESKKMFNFYNNVVDALKLDCSLNRMVCVPIQFHKNDCINNIDRLISNQCEDNVVVYIVLKYEITGDARNTNNMMEYLRVAMPYYTYMHNCAIVVICNQDDYKFEESNGFELVNVNSDEKLDIMVDL